MHVLDGGRLAWRNSCCSAGRPASGSRPPSSCSRAGCEVAVLGWVFARSQLYGPVIAGLEDSFGEVHQLYLVASPDVLKQRLLSRGALDRWEYSISRLELIRELPYPRIDTSDLSPSEVAERVLDHIRAL